MYVNREYNEYCYMIIKRKSFENTFHFLFFRRLVDYINAKSGEGTGGRGEGEEERVLFFYNTVAVFFFLSYVR